MPLTPEFAIPYPCEGAAIAPADFSAFAFGVEAAITAVSAQATNVLTRTSAYVAWTTNPAFAVETTVTFSTSAVHSSNVTVNTGAGTMTIITPGAYLVTFTEISNQSSLTITSQRLSIAVNTVNQYIKKFQGTNPASATPMGGSTEGVVFLNSGDVVTYKYLWTGTGALLNPASGRAGLYLLATP